MTALTPGARVRDSSGTLWLVEAVGELRITGTPTATLRCLQPGLGLRGTDVGDVTTRSQRGLEVVG